MRLDSSKSEMMRGSIFPATIIRSRCTEDIYVFAKAD